MMETMELIALTVGILFGLIVMTKHGIDYVLIMVFSSLFSSKNGFMEMYEAADDEVTYKFYVDPTEGIKSYADYLRLHEAAKDTAYKRFSYFYDNITKTLFFRLLPIVLLPALLFWSSLYLYILGVAVSIAGLAIYKVVVKGYRVGFYQRLIIHAVLSNYLKDSRPN